MVIVNIRLVGAAALMIEVGESDVEAWRSAVVASTIRVREIVPGARTLLLDGLADPKAAAAEIRTWRVETSAAKIEPRKVHIPVRYDGADLDAVSALWGMTTAEAITTISAIEFRVAFFGFAPGFAYLAGLPPELAVPRLTTPRTRVPSGSVALADTYAGIYPTASPGGWHLIGHTDVVMFDVDQDPPAHLRHGDLVRLTP